MKSTAMPPAPAAAEKQLKAFIEKFDDKNQAVIRATRRALRRLMPSANELVYDNYNFFVIGYCPTERPPLDVDAKISYFANYARTRERGVSSNQVFRALADETRRDILRMLRDGPLSSGEIAARFRSSWPTISRHLGVLRDAHLVVTERVGQEIRYELNTSVFQDVVQHLIEWTRPTAGGRGRIPKPHRPRQQET